MTVVIPLYNKRPSNGIKKMDKQGISETKSREVKTIAIIVSGT